MVVVTMYAEAPDELTTTLEGIAQNIYHMNKEHQDSNGAAGASWKEIVVVVVSDGIQKINNDTFRLAERLGMARQSMIFQSQFEGIVIPDMVQVRGACYVVVRHAWCWRQCHAAHTRLRPARARHTV